MYDAVAEGSARRVALKVLRRGRGNLGREARIGGLLRHPGLVDVYEVGERDGRAWCALERCDGTLAEHLPLPPRAVVEVGIAVCEALGYAHLELGLVHLDLKPRNLLVSRGRVKVADLGIARARGFDDGQTLRGTPGYMAPEQLRGGPLDTRTDVWALGVTLIELATGARPGAAPTLDAAGLEPEEGPDCPAWLAPAAARCLEPDPRDRWPDLAALANALRALEVGGPGLCEALGAPPESREPVVGEFVGRAADLAALRAALEAPGVVVVRGAAGAGKSRLAAEAVRPWGGAVAWCDCAPVRTGDGLMGAVADALGVPLANERIDAQIAGALAARGRFCLVLDGFEHLVAHAGELSRWAGPETRVLVTSRVATRIPGEHERVLGPLPDAEARALLIARARDRGVDVGSSPELDALAGRLDGLPLALELAAGRLGVLSVRDVLERFDLSLLRTGDDHRHGTLRAAIAWSWELLAPSEQRALAALSVFGASFRVAAAEAVLGPDAAPALAALLDHSLLSRDAQGRLHLLASVRAFAAEALGDDEAPWIRHGRWFAALGEPAALAALDGADGVIRRRNLTSELDDLVVAARRAVARGDGPVARGACCAAWAVFELRGPFVSAVDLTREVLEMPGLAPDDRGAVAYVAGRALHRSGRLDEAEVRLAEALALAPGAEVWVGLAAISRERGRSDEARSRLESALSAARGAGDRRTEAVALGSLGNLDRDAGRIAEAGARYAAALAIHRAERDRRHEAHVLGSLATLALEQGDAARAEALNLESLSANREVGDRRNEAITLTNLAITYRRAGDLARARATNEAALAAHQELGSHNAAGVVSNNLANVLFDLGELDAAEERFQAALAMHRATSSRRMESIALVNLGRVAAARGDAVAAWRRYEDSLAITREIGNRRLEGYVLGQMARAAGEPVRGLALADEALRLLRTVGDPAMIAEVLAVAAELHPDRAEAVRLLDEARAAAPADSAAVLAEIARVAARRLT